MNFFESSDAISLKVVLNVKEKQIEMKIVTAGLIKIAVVVVVGFVLDVVEGILEVVVFVETIYTAKITIDFPNIFIFIGNICFKIDSVRFIYSQMK